MQKFTKPKPFFRSLELPIFVKDVKVEKFTKKH